MQNYMVGVMFFSGLLWRCCLLDEDCFVLLLDEDEEDLIGGGTTGRFDDLYS